MTDAALKTFSEDVGRLGVMPLWERAQSMMAPGTSCVPMHWPYETLRPKLIEAASLIDEERAERRVLVLENPSLRGTTFVTTTLYAGLQIIMPGEIAPVHRHSPSALRFLIEGEGGYTEIGGERVPMHAGDFVVTPSWAWHSHGNDGSGPVVWLDGLDTPFTRFFGATFRDNGPPRENAGAPREGASLARFGASLLPLDFSAQGISSPLLIYPYARTRAALKTVAEAGPPHECHGYKMRYADPKTGGHPFPTMAVFLQLLREGFSGRPHRSTDGAVYAVVEGAGEAEIGEETFAFSARDVFVAPSWTRVRFSARAQTVLFSFSDRAAQEALGLFREE